MLASLSVQLPEAVSCLHVTSDFVSIGTLDGSVHILSNPFHPSNTSLAAQSLEYHTFPGGKGITTGCQVGESSMLYGDRSGKVFVLHPFKQHNKPIKSIENTSGDLNIPVAHITANVARGDITAVTDLRGTVRLYSTHDMQHRRTLEGDFDAGVVGVGDNLIFAPSASQQCLNLFDLRQSKKQVLKMVVPDLITCVSDTIDTDLLVMGSAGGRCFVARCSDVEDAKSRCFVPFTDRVDLTCVNYNKQRKLITCGGSDGSVNVVESLSGHNVFKNSALPGAVVGAQTFMDNKLILANVQAQSSTIRFLTLPATPSR